MESIRRSPAATKRPDTPRVSQYVPLSSPECELKMLLKIGQCLALQLSDRALHRCACLSEIIGAGGSLGTSVRRGGQTQAFEVSIFDHMIFDCFSSFVGQNELSYS